MGLGSLRSAKLLRIFGSSVIDQAVLSAANFLVGIILIRYAGDSEYGYYILIFNAIMLVTMLQNSFIGTPFVIRLPGIPQEERRQWVGSLLRDQNRAAGWLIAIALAGIAGLWLTEALDVGLVWLSIAAVAAVATSLFREFLRNILLIYQLPHLVLVSDLVYVVGIVAGSILAVQYPMAAMVVVLAVAASALLAAYVLRYVMRSMIDRQAAPGRLWSIAPIGAWAATGAAVYWIFNQGYSFIAAGTLSIAAVAALAAARLIMMPVNLLCSGVQKQLTSMASQWLHDDGAVATLRRLLRFAAILGAGVIVYALIAWLFRDWIFVDLLRKSDTQNNLFLILWAAIFFIKALRDPPMLLLMMRQRFRVLTFSSLVCALLSLVLSYTFMLEYGAVGALWGILAGEVLSLLTTLYFSWREAVSGASHETTAPV